MVALGIALFTIWFVRINGRYFGDFLAPNSVLGAVWGTALCLYYMKFIAYIDLRPYTIILIGLGFSAFVFGSMVVIKRVGFRKEIQNVGKPIIQLRKSVSQTRLFFSCSILFSIGMVGQVLYLYRASSIVSSDLWLGQVNALHWETSIGELRSLGVVGVLASTNLVNMVLLVAYLALFRSSRYGKGSRTIIGIQFIITLAFILFRTGRTGIFIPIIWAVVTLVYINGGLKLSRKDLVFSGVLIAILVSTFLVWSQFLGSAERADDLKPVWNSSLPFNPGFASIYLYASSAIPAFQVFVDQQTAFLWGQSTFVPVLRVAQIFVPSIQLVDTVRSFVLVPAPTNVYTYLAPFYEDFGIFGVAILPFLLGGLMTHLYIRQRRRPSLAIVLIGSLLTTTLFWSAFQSIQIFVIVWYFGAIALIVGWVVRKERNPVQYVTVSKRVILGRT